MPGNIFAPQVRSSVPRNQGEITNQIYVGIVTSHSLVTHHLVDLLKMNNVLPVILGAGAKNAAILPTNAQAIIIIDLWGLPRPTSEYLDHFSATIPKCAFLALDRPRDGIEIARFLRAGFSGFITYDEALHSLAHAIKAIAEERVWASPEVMRIYMNLTSRRTMSQEAGVETLTIRENQVLELLRRRCSNKEMANLLRISESTVKFHVSNVLMKLNVNDRRDLTDTETPGLISSKSPGLVMMKPPGTNGHSTGDNGFTNSETLSKPAKTGS